MANEVLQSTNDTKVRSEFEKVLPLCFNKLGSTVDEQKINSLLMKWLDKQIFSKDFIDKLDGIFKGATKPEPEAIEDPAVAAVQLMMNIITQESVKRDKLKERVDNIRNDLFIGKMCDPSPSNARREFDDARNILKEYENALISDIKHRAEFEQMLQVILHDVVKGTDESQTELKRIQRKRRQMESSSLEHLKDSDKSYYSSSSQSSSYYSKHSRSDRYDDRYNHSYREKDYGKRSSDKSFQSHSKRTKRDEQPSQSKYNTSKNVASPPKNVQSKDSGWEPTNDDWGSTKNDGWSEKPSNISVQKPEQTLSSNDWSNSVSTPGDGWD